ncbi:MAG TPA: flagellar protein FliS [Lachnospiraceae bacterium]|nr:flagellar protein FliS [Lachnospiraceae bacterium]
MDNEQIREYTARISQANRSGLVNIVYELFAYSIDRAGQAFDADDKDTAVKYLKKAQECVCELKRNLNFHYEISYNLASLYRYVHEQIIASITKRKPVNFDIINKIMGDLQSAFIEVSKQDTSGAVMQNTQKVYAGLTYGRGKLNEVFMNGNERSRGFVV